MVYTVAIISSHAHSRFQYVLLSWCYTVFTTYFNYEVCVKSVVEDKEHWFIHLEDALRLCMIRSALHITVCSESCIAANCQQLLTWKDSVRTLMYARNVERIEKAVLKRESWGMVNVRRSFRLGQHFVRMGSEQLLRHWEHFDTGGGASSSISSRASAAMINNLHQQHMLAFCLYAIWSGQRQWY